MRRLGIVDLGSNTARLAVFDHEPGEWFRLVDGIREPVRLGSGLAKTGALTADGIERALAALRLFGDYAQATQLDEIDVIGTSALRDATNAAEFMAAVEPLHLSVSVLSGDDEAALGVLAVANSFDLSDAWVMDLGGGSAQISRMRERRFETGTAYPLGAVRLTEQHIAHDPPRKREVRALRATVEGELAEVCGQIRASDAPVIAIGGTIRNLARAVQESAGDPLGRLHGYVLERAALAELTNELLGQKRRLRARKPGLNPDRADIILAGALVYLWLLESSGRDGLMISGQGVREGAFYRRFLPAPHLLDDVRRFTVENLKAQYGQKLAHVDRVVRLSLQIFDALEPLHGFGESERALLEAAGHLHDVGMTVDYHRHHKHGAYLLSSTALHGFSHREQILISALVRYHRKGMPRLGAYRRLAHPGDTEVLLRLASCLRLAEQLDRSRAGRVVGVRAKVKSAKVLLRLTSTERPTVELWEAAKHSDLFRRAYGKKLQLAAE